MANGVVFINGRGYLFTTKQEKEGGNFCRLPPMSFIVSTIEGADKKEIQFS